MRLLVACTECKRRYDASKCEIGSLFRCRCGAIVTVVNPRGHNARVVRCSSCGAAREGGRMACSHCGSDFTLHERDLETVCPECLARVSDRAKFCHYCGTPLFGGEDVGKQTSRLCPACAEKSRLHSRRLGKEKVSALECDHCAGLWLGVGAFEQLARRAQRAQPVSVISRRKKRPQTQIARPPQRSGYRPCPICKKLMNRTNYGHRQRNGGSGTIIDICRDHGIWFDSDELTSILAWLGEGGQSLRVTAPRRSSAASAKELKKQENTCPNCDEPVSRSAVTCPRCQSNLTQLRSKRPGRSRKPHKPSASENDILRMDIVDVLPNVAHKLGAMLGSLFDVGGK